MPKAGTGGPGLGDLFQFPFCLRISAFGVVLGPLLFCFSQSFSELPPPVHLQKFPIRALPTVLCLGEPLLHGKHSAPLTFERLSECLNRVSQRTGTFPLSFL